MKKNKIMFLVLVTALIITVAGCSPADTKFRNMETRLNNNERDDGWLNKDSNRLNTKLNNGMTRQSMDTENQWDNNTNLNNPIGRNNTNLDGDRLNNNSNNMSTRANDIAKRVAALSEVNNASVVINGDTAIVGITTNKNNATNNNVSSSLRKKIEAAVKAGDKNIKDIKITSDSDITTRLKTMTTELDRGNPISEFTKDIEDILERIANPRR